jgi:hypothetical protein
MRVRVVGKGTEGEYGAIAPDIGFSQASPISTSPQRNRAETNRPERDPATPALQSVLLPSLVWFRE